MILCSKQLIDLLSLALTLWRTVVVLMAKHVLSYLACLVKFGGFEPDQPYY